MTISLFDRVGNTVGKGENAGYHYLLHFPQCFQSLLLNDRYKSGLCGKELSNVFNQMHLNLSFMSKLITLFTRQQNVKLDLIQSKCR